MNTMFDHLDISVNNTPHPLTVMVEDLEAEHSTERWVLAHLTKEEALKMCDRILAEIKSKPDCPKIIIDSVSDFVKCGRPIYKGMLNRHFKGGIYQVLNFAEYKGTGEALVIYQEKFGAQKIYARPFSEFSSEVDHAKHPETTQKYRFEQITGDLSYQNAEKDCADSCTVTVSNNEIGP